jgi:hypothetical protein
MRIGSGRQEVFQYVRSLYETLEREIAGVFGVRDTGPDATGMPFVIGTSTAKRAAFESSYGVQVREGADTMFMTTALVARDTDPNSPTKGQIANVAHVAYWVTPDDHVLHRYESYDLTRPASGRGFEFALNVLEFRIELIDPFTSTVEFEHKDWDSRDLVEVLPGRSERRGLPKAIRVMCRVTDADHLDLYQFDDTTKTNVLKPGMRSSDDPVVRTFSQVLHMQETQ